MNAYVKGLSYEKKLNLKRNIERLKLYKYDIEIQEIYRNLLKYFEELSDESDFESAKDFIKH